ncbi:peptide/nickel transport system permease protein [Proteiniborus sp. DW1]|uniref:ABC transporter permease n=1 Tax=Proteiniborus sp. DW1 TaxID=1889883 RepID=UPI00092E0074|nr:ABC transporter permease [Proteiniborus sp. DW1]SCG82210.1 peptide/nickel transport system permease protein [Proteiniborus sp. DW1]
MIKGLGVTFEKMYKHPLYRALLLVFGILSLPFVVIKYFRNRQNNNYAKLRESISQRLELEGIKDEIYEKAEEQLKNKLVFFNKELSTEEFKRQVKEIANKQFNEAIENELSITTRQNNVKNFTFCQAFIEMFNNKLFLFISIIISLPMYILILIFSNPYTKFITERLFMMVFVIFGVTWLVFTILYLSPMDPAVNILGQTATPEQVAQFNSIYGLDKPYHIQLFNTFKSLFSFDLGKSYVGNEDVMAALMRKFPVTLKLTFASLIIAIIIAIPAGIISAIKQYSSFDYVFMLFALLGLSIPNFWLGLIMILNFSIKMQWLPATFIVGNWKTLIMPSIVLGTGLAASVARMTRSSMLEVKNADYITTARAKGLSERKVIVKHILGNAMIPIVTVVGLQFGGMLGGSAVTEKVFNINGIGSFIVDKQFVPDIPIVLAGVVYVAVIISLANLIVDIMYAFLDPRIKSKMKSY